MQNKQRALLIAMGAFLICQPGYCQSWGQLKGQAIEAQSARNYAEAAGFWKKALDACENTTGPRYVQSIAGLARSYADLEKNKEAEDCYKEILELSGSPPVSDDLKTALIDYAAFLRKLKKEAEASEIETKFSLVPTTPAKAETVEKPAYRPPAPDAKIEKANALKNFQTLIAGGAKEAARKNYLQAEQLFKQSLQSAEKQNDLKLKAEALNKLISLCFSENKPALAEPYYLQSLSVTRAENGNNSREYAHALLDYGQFLRKLNRKPEALAQEAKAEQILAKLTESGPPASAATTQIGQPQTFDRSVTRRGSVSSRARAVQKGMNTDDATKQMIDNTQ